MKPFQRFLLLLAAIVLTTKVQAQVINGDLNHNGDLDVDDVTLLIDGYLTGETESLKSMVNPYMVDNSLIAGTWYSSKTNSTIFNADGTFGGILQGLTYKYMPFQKHILMYGPDGSFVQENVVLELTADSMLLKWPDGTCHLLTRTPPKEYISSIELSRTSVVMRPNTLAQLTATIYPADADDPRVSWSSSDEWVATVDDGWVYAQHSGTATITCTAADGSGVQVTCTVTVVGNTINNGHEYVDLGLSVKWATMNIGAKATKKYGDYFAWGETEPKDTYSWSNNKWSNGSSSTLTKYNTKNYNGTVDNKIVLDLEDDAAHANWGGTWRMPTCEECQELVDRCTATLISLNGVNGYKVTGPNGNSIFFPAAGDRFFDSLKNVGDYGQYRSSSLNVDDPVSGWILDFNSNQFFIGYSDRSNGLSVRAVCP